MHTFLAGRGQDGWISVLPLRLQVERLSTVVLYTVLSSPVLCGLVFVSVSWPVFSVASCFHVTLQIESFGWTVVCVVCWSVTFGLSFSCGLAVLSLVWVSFLTLHVLHTFLMRLTTSPYELGFLRERAGNGKRMESVSGGQVAMDHP